MNFHYVQCKHCGWIHFAVTRTYAEDEVARFNTYFETLTKEEQQSYYGGVGSSIKQYEHCNFCGKPADMIEPTKVLNGSTVGPIIWESEDETK